MGFKKKGMPKTSIAMIHDIIHDMYFDKLNKGEDIEDFFDNLTLDSIKAYQMDRNKKKKRRRKRKGGE